MSAVRNLAHPRTADRTDGRRITPAVVCPAESGEIESGLAC